MRDARLAQALSELRALLLRESQLAQVDRPDRALLQELEQPREDGGVLQRDRALEEGHLHGRLVLQQPLQQVVHLLRVLLVDDVVEVQHRGAGLQEGLHPAHHARRQLVAPRPTPAGMCEREAVLGNLALSQDQVFALIAAVYFAQGADAVVVDVALAWEHARVRAARLARPLAAHPRFAFGWECGRATTREFARVVWVSFLFYVFLRRQQKPEN